MQRHRPVRSIIFDDVPQPEERQQVEPAIHLRGRMERLAAQRQVVIARSVPRCPHAEIVVFAALGITQVLQQARQITPQQGRIPGPRQIDCRYQFERCQALFALDPVGGVISQRADPVEQVPVAGLPVGMHDPGQQDKQGAVYIDAAQRVAEDRMVVLGIAPDPAERFEISDGSGIFEVFTRQREARQGGGRFGGLAGGRADGEARQHRRRKQQGSHGRSIRFLYQTQRPWCFVSRRGGFSRKSVTTTSVSAHRTEAKRSAASRRC